MEEKLSNSEIEKKLAQLEKMKESNSLRIKRYLQKKRAAGYQNISALIKVESYEIINNERDKALKEGKQLTTADIIEHALQVAYKRSEPFTPAIIDSIGSRFNF